MNPKAIIFFDLDGTLLTGPNQIAPSSLAAIERLRRNGYLPVIATGRATHEIEVVLQQTSIDSIVSMNGQYVVSNGSLIYSNPFRKTDIEALKTAAQKKNYNLTYYSDDEITAEKSDDHWTQINYESLHSVYPQVNPQLYITKDIYLIMLLSEHADADFEAQFPQLTFLRNTPHGYDVVPNGSSKAVGIEAFIKKQQYENIPTYAFGDGINDLEMFNYVDTAVAMGNAVAPLKAAADYVTADFKADGIMKALVHFGLIEEEKECTN